jgi:hypothetical protein
MFGRNRYYSDGTKVQSFGIFIAPIAISIVIGMPLVTRYPIPIAILIVSFGITFVLVLLCSSYGAIKANYYFQKHNFQLWKKSRSHSLRDRTEAVKELESLSLQIPYLIKKRKFVDHIIFILFAIWTLIFLAVFSFIVFSAVSSK